MENESMESARNGGTERKSNGCSLRGGLIEDGVYQSDDGKNILSPLTVLLPAIPENLP